MYLNPLLTSVLSMAATAPMAFPCCFNRKTKKPGFGENRIENDMEKGRKHNIYSQSFFFPDSPT